MTKDLKRGINPPSDPEQFESDAPFLHELATCTPDVYLRALQASEARLRALVEHTQDWVWEVNEQGRYTYASTRVREMLGYTPEEVLGKTPFDFMPPEERARVLELFTNAVARRAPLQGLENTNQHKDGSLVVLETNGVPFFDNQGNFAGYRGIDRDITKRKRIETALRRKSDELEAMFSTTHILIAVMDREFNFLRVNKAYAAVVRRDEESLIGRNHFELYPHEEHERQFRQVVETGEPCSVIAEPCKHPGLPLSDTTIWDWTLTPIKDADGCVEGVVLTLIDTTERERQRQAAEAAHWQAQAQLEQRVRERTAALEAANRELEAFSYAVSHDLRAPLRAIKGFSLALREDYAGVLDDLGRVFLERIQYATLRMSDLIDGLLNLSVISRTELQRQPVDLSALAHDIIQQLREQEPARKLVIDIEPGLTAVGDATLLRLLLQNLLGNAWKFTTCCAEAHIKFGQECLMGHDVFVVRDNGIGFEMDQASRLFRPFIRLHGQDEFEGNGIGLATVRRIVERHGGSVGAEGSPQKGACFYFTLKAIVPVELQGGAR